MQVPQRQPQFLAAFAQGEVPQQSQTASQASSDCSAIALDAISLVDQVDMHDAAIKGERASRMTRRRWGHGARRMVEQIVMKMNEDSDIPSASGVTQHYSATPMSKLPAALYALLQPLCQKKPTARVLVFFSALRLTRLYAALFAATGMPLLEVHANMDRPLRESIYENFSRDGGLLFCSDVAATVDGEHLVGASAVVQVGLPSSTSIYRQRLSLCAAGGKAHLLLCEFDCGGEVPCCMQELSPQLQPEPLEQSKPPSAEQVHPTYPSLHSSLTMPMAHLRTRTPASVPVPGPGRDAEQST